MATSCAPWPSVDRPQGAVTTVTTVTTASLQGGVDGAPDQQPATDTEHNTIDAHSTVDRIVAGVPEGAGLAVASGVRGSELWTAGELSSDVAWSTIKVPLAIAALRASPELDRVSESAITTSDNAAAETLWRSLGSAQAASAAVQEVLAEAGDSVTVVPAVQLRVGFSVFGQTEWPLAQQARFSAGVLCHPDADPVLQQMQRIDPAQQWGLGRVPGAAFKGGWGPTSDGSGYLVRQFGLIPAGEGVAAVAIAAYGPDLEGGAGILDGLADSIAANAHELPTVRCS